MTEEEANEKAYTMMAIGLPASFVENPATSKMTKKAVTLRKLIATAICDAYKLGRHSTGHEIAKLAKAASKFDVMKSELLLLRERWGDEDFDPLEVLEKLLEKLAD